MEYDFSTVTTDEIVDELAKRFDCLALFVSQDLTPTSESGMCWYRGGRYRALGLVQEQVYKLINMQNIKPETET